MILGSLNLIYSQNEYKNKTNSSNRQDSLSQVNTKIKPQPEHVYVIFTSKEYDPESEHGITEGVMRIETCYPYTNDMALISYTFLSRSKNTMQITTITTIINGIQAKDQLIAANAFADCTAFFASNPPKPKTQPSAAVPIPDPTFIQK